MADSHQISFREAQLLSKIGMQVATKSSIEEIIVNLHDHLRQIIPVDVFAIGLYQKKSNSLDFHGKIEDEVVTGNDPLDEKRILAAWCFKHQQPIYINDLTTEFGAYLEYYPKPFNEETEQRLSYLYVPLMNAEDEAIGVVTTQCYVQQAYIPQHLVFLESLAGYISIALQNMNLISEVRIGEEEVRAMNRLMELNVEKALALKSRLEVEKEAMNKSAIVSIGDLQGNITEVNDLFCEISQFSREELIGKNHNIINSNYHDRAFWEEIWQTIARGESWQGEVCNRAKDGSIYWVDTVIVPFLDHKGKPSQYFSLQKDITERKKILADLHAKERILSNLLHNMQGLLYRCRNDENWSMEFISEGVSRLTGYRVADVMDGTVTFGADIIHVDDRKKVWTTVQDATDAKQPYWIEYRIVTAKSEIKWVLERGRGIFEGEKLVALEGFITDSSEMKAAQFEIERTKERLQITLDAAEVFWWENHIASGRVLHDTNFYFDFLGYDEGDQVIPQDIAHVMDLVHPDDRELMKEAIRAHLEGLTTFFTIEARYRRKDGAWVWVRSRGRLVNKEDQEGLFLGISYDISKRKQRETIIREQHEELLASEEEMRQQAEELKAINENLEYTLKELKATQNHLVESEKMAALGQLVANVAHEVNTPLGAINSSISTVNDVLVDTFPKFPIFLSTLPEKLIEPFLQLVQHGLQTKIKPTQKEQREYRKVLEEVLNSRNISNSKTFAKKLVSMGVYERIDQYTELLSAPKAMAIIDMAYQFAKMQRSARTIKIAAERAGKVIYALKSYARHDSSGNKMNVEIKDGIDTVITLYHNLIKQGVDVVRSYETGLMAPCYPDELNQVWMNIIHNALQAMDYKGVLTIRTHQEGCFVVVEIQDTGKGIAEEVRENIFNAFFTTKPIGEGSGLGLNIVKRILDKHQAKIEFQSEVNKGTTFKVMLP
ncbi:MAG: PAS domain-containing protein, partial [Flammeovirgaceae bacterium]